MTNYFFVVGINQCNGYFSKSLQFCQAISCQLSETKKIGHVLWTVQKEKIQLSTPRRLLDLQ